MNIPKSENPRIVIIGGGFAGIEFHKKLKNKPYQLVLLDRNNFFTFQPLLYQVATAGLEPNSVAYPYRLFLRGYENAHFRMAEVEGIDPLLKKVVTNKGSISYDYLVLAHGSQVRFFGLEEKPLLPLKTMAEAINMRQRLLQSFEHALEAQSQEERQSYLNIVIAGGGPTGVELAGAFGEMKQYILPRDYPEFKGDSLKIHLVEGQERVLPSMSKEASKNSKKYLEKLGVKVHLNKLVKSYNGREVDLGDERIPTKNMIWTAGVEVAVPDGVDKGILLPNGRMLVNAFNQLNGFENIFVIGDAAAMHTKETPDGHPMLAPVAMQQGRHLAKNLLRLQQGKALKAFRYLDKGSMATIGRNKAVVDLAALRFKGFFAWIVWMFVHILYLIGFRNKVVTLFNWIYSYFTYDKALRLIIKRQSESALSSYDPEDEKVLI